MPKKKPAQPAPATTLYERIYASLPVAPEGCYWMLHEYKSEMLPCGAVLTLVLRRKSTQKFRLLRRDKLLFAREVFEPSAVSPWEHEEEYLLRRIGHTAYDINQLFLSSQRVEKVRSDLFGQGHALRF